MPQCVNRSTPRALPSSSASGLRARPRRGRSAMGRPDSLDFARSALQKGFITEAQARSALAACLADPAKTIEQVLMADGVISATKAMVVFGELGGAPEPPKKRYRFGTEIGRGGLGRV